MHTCSEAIYHTKQTYSIVIHFYFKNINIRNKTFKVGVCLSTFIIAIFNIFKSEEGAMRNNENIFQDICSMYL